MNIRKSHSGGHSVKMRKGMNYWFSQKRDGFYTCLVIMASLIYVAGLAVTEYELGSNWPLLSSRLKTCGFLVMLMVITMFLIHRNLHGLHQFLGLFRQADHLPKKQIAHVNSFCMTVFLSITLVSAAVISPLLDFVWAAIIAWFQGAWKPITLEPPIMESMPQKQMPPPDLTEIFGEPSPPSPWMEAAEKVFFVIVWILIALVFFFLIRSLLRSIWSWITKPRHFDEDEKIYLKPVFSLPSEKQAEQGDSEKHYGLRHYFSYNSRIRRLYRKAILSGHGRNKRPQEWASPSELESSAALDNLTLHELYEKARYGREPCTEDDWNKL